jgi:hypothetical protein
MRTRYAALQPRDAAVRDALCPDGVPLLVERHFDATPAHAVRAQAVFLNREEIPVRALYRDPVHDFGFFVFDPSLLQFMEVRAAFTLGPF